MTPGTKRKRRRQSAQETNARRVLLSSDVVTSLQTIGGMTGHTEIKDTIGMLCRRYAHDASIKVFFSFACLLPAIPIIHGKCILQFIIPRPAGVFDRTRQAGWGADSLPPPSRLTCESMGVARRVRQQSKALDECFLGNFKTFS